MQRSLRDLAALYGCEASLSSLEHHRESLGLLSISATCFGAANLSAIFLDDGIQFDKMNDWEWHKSFAPAVGRILRIEHLAETILNNVSFLCYVSLMNPANLCFFSESCRPCGHFCENLCHMLENGIYDT